MGKLSREFTDLSSRLLPLDAPYEESGRLSAVLVLLFPGGHEGPSDAIAGAKFLLTVRHAELSRHAGQISLPGGSFEPEDADLWHTALRETREELGIETDEIFPLGRLHALPARVSEFFIVPYVGWIAEPPTMQPDSQEVEEVIEASVSDLLQPERIETETWKLSDALWEVTFYRLGSHVVWGLTAHILHDLVTRIEVGMANVEPRPGSVSPV